LPSLLTQRTLDAPGLALMQHDGLDKSR
jgi:hypothetical protein